MLSGEPVIHWEFLFLLCKISLGECGGRRFIRRPLWPPWAASFPSKKASGFVRLYPDE